MKIYLKNSWYFNCIYFHFKYHSYMYYTHFHLYLLILDF